MKDKWSKLTKPDKIITILIIILSVAVIALAALQLLAFGKTPSMSMSP